MAPTASSPLSTSMNAMLRSTRFSTLVPRTGNLGA